MSVFFAKHFVKMLYQFLWATLSVLRVILFVFFFDHLTDDDDDDTHISKISLAHVLILKHCAIILLAFLYLLTCLHTHDVRCVLDEIL